MLSELILGALMASSRMPRISAGQRWRGNTWRVRLLLNSHVRMIGYLATRAGEIHAHLNKQAVSIAGLPRVERGVSGRKTHRQMTGARTISLMNCGSLT